MLLHPFLTRGRHINYRTVETSAEKARELDVHSSFDFTTDVNNTPYVRFLSIFGGLVNGPVQHTGI